MRSNATRIIHCDPLDAATMPALGEAVVAIGIFDGMHLGHRALFALARARARKLGMPLVAVTFDRDPDEIFRTDDPSFGKLLSNRTRLEMIAAQVDGAVLSIPVSAEVLAIEPEAFLDLLGASMSPRFMFTGTDFRFGAHARGTGADIASWGAAHGCEHVACDLVEDDGVVVSSSRIRSLLEQGDVAEAKRLLGGRAHAIDGIVVRGRGAGEGFGFATANLDTSACEVMAPREGVYGAYAVVGGERHPAAVNVGVARSFEEASAPVEAHLLGFEGDLYGKDVSIEFEEWLREPRVFASDDELVETVMGNIDWVRTHLGGR